MLRLLAAPGQAFGVNRIARELSIAPSSCFKILKQLVAEGYVDFDDESKCYSLGNNAVLIARQALDPRNAFTVVRSRFERVAREFSMAMGLWRVVCGERIMLAGFVEGESNVRIHMSVGQRLPLLMGGVGRAIAARLDLSRPELCREFHKLRWEGAISFDEYADQVAEARRLGYALDRGNFSPGVRTIAVAIVDHAGAPRYGISGIMFDGGRADANMDRIARELLDIGAWAAERLAE